MFMQWFVNLDQNKPFLIGLHIKTPRHVWSVSFNNLRRHKGSPITILLKVNSSPLTINIWTLYHIYIEVLQSQFVRCEYKPMISNGGWVSSPENMSSIWVLNSYLSNHFPVSSLEILMFQMLSWQIFKFSDLRQSSGWQHVWVLSKLNKLEFTSNIYILFQKMFSWPWVQSTGSAGVTKCLAS